MSDLIAGMINPSRLDDVWSKMAPWILQAMDAAGEANSEALCRIKNDIARGACQLWGVMTEGEAEILAVIVTGTGMIGGRSAVVVRYLCGREMDKWLNGLAIIERWAMDNGFEVVEVWGRPGWIKVLSSHGYKHSYHVLEKDVSREIH